MHQMQLMSVRIFEFVGGVQSAQGIDQYASNNPARNALLPSPCRAKYGSKVTPINEVHYEKDAVAGFSEFDDLHHVRVTNTGCDARFLEQLFQICLWGFEQLDGNWAGHTRYLVVRQEYRCCTSAPNTAFYSVAANPLGFVCITL
jgi:hypothetical protein